MTKKRDPVAIEQHRRERQQRKVDRWWKILSNCAIVFLIVFLCFGRVLVVRGSSMEPTYHNRNLLIGIKPFTEETLLEKNFPVCVVKQMGDMTLIKRLIGKPGDKVELINGDTYVNGIKVMSRPADAFDNQTFELGEDDWLFLGDNRAHSTDGRYWPGHFVSFDDILYYVPGSELVPIYVSGS